MKTKNNDDIIAAKAAMFSGEIPFDNFSFQDVIYNCEMYVSHEKLMLTITTENICHANINCRYGT